MWVEEVVEALAECRRDRLPFNAAWTHVIQRHPPRLRELGISGVLADSLFDQSGAQALEWFRGVCESAYDDAPALDGSPSRLRGLHAALEASFEEQMPARGRSRGGASNSGMIPA
jgi:hypothetical protein